jgi:hypothetical protein
LLPAGAVAGWGLHPLESAAFARRTPNPEVASPGINCLFYVSSGAVAMLRPLPGDAEFFRASD